MTLNNLFKTFFASDKIDTIDEASMLIGELLSALGTSHDESKIEMEGKDTLGWMVNIGTVYVYIYVFKSEDEKIYLKVISPIVFLPEKNILPFYRALLESNMYLNGFTLGIEKNLALLLRIKRIEEVKLEEAKKIVEQTAKLSLDISEKLIEDFKAVKFEIQ
ncbi:MAG: hypothetical protein AB7T10_01455 [bacterium]